MDSPLALLETGEYTGAVLTTFTIDLTFIDRWVLPRLAHAGVRNVVVLCDDSQLAAELSQGATTRAGRDYQVGVVECAGVFHPKIIYLSGPEKQIACVSSANLTASGQLRNLETAAVIESDEDEHQRALSEVASFLMELAADQPPNVAESLQSILQYSDPAAPNGSGSVAFVHNLHEPIGPRLPGGPTIATSPFASRSAGIRLAQDRELSVAVDARRYEAIGELQDLDLDLRVVSFTKDEQHRHRVTHGKAYWSVNNGWCFVGSPNLTNAALYSTRNNGNVEAGLLFTDEYSFDLPPHDEVDAPVIAAAPQTPARDHKEATPGTFTAHFDEILRVGGVSDGTPIDVATDEGWSELGVVVDGEVVFAETALSLTRLRARTPEGPLFALVHNVPYLRARRRAPASRRSGAIKEPPLDLQGVRELEWVLGELYALDEIAAEETSRRQKSIPSIETVAVGSDALAEWRPAHPGHEPRIPDLYRQAFDDDPDAFLAMIRHALRLETDPDVEQPAVEDNEELDEEAADKAKAEEDDERSPHTSAPVVRRYRNSLLRALDRGSERVSQTTDTALRDLTFQTVLVFHEKIADARVRIPAGDAKALGYTDAPEDDDNVEIPLVEPDALAPGRFAILAAYVGAAPEIVGDCAATFFAHLPAALLDRDLLEEIDRRKLDEIAYEHAGALLSQTPTDQTIGLPWISPARAAEVLQEYADRTDWFAIVDNCEQQGWITDGDLFLEPYPIITGATDFAGPVTASPAWQLLGEACIAGYSDEHPFGVVINNSHAASPVVTHCLRVAPTGRAVRGDQIEEAWLRRADGKWISRTLDGFTRDQGKRLLTSVGVKRVFDDLGISSFNDSQNDPILIADLMSAHQALSGSEP